MTDFLIALDATAGIWAFIALCGGIAALFIWAEHRADQQQTPEPTEPEICGSSFGAYTCFRHAGHDGPHVDPYHGTAYGPTRWYGLGGAA